MSSSAPPRLRPARSRPRVESGLRLQILLALGALMLLAFLPLFFAVASLTRATVLGEREASARALIRLVAAGVDRARARGDADEIRRTLDEYVRSSPVDAACAFAPADGVALVRIACAPGWEQAAALRAPAAGARESSTVVRVTSGRELELLSPSGRIVVVARARLEADRDRGAPLVGLVALYMGVFALALLVFAYFALTRLIVRPIEQLVGAADRVASGGRTLDVPMRGARELLDLGSSVRAMAEELIGEEAALRRKVDELTETTRRLTQTQAQLVRSARLASVGTLAAGVAHEIGNPIAAIMGMTDLLRDDDLPADARADFIARIHRETERVHAILRDLLDFARPEGQVRGATDTRDAPACADVHEVLGDAVALVRPQRSFRDVDVATAIEGAPCVALSAPQLTQVLLNLLLNAGAAIARGREGAAKTGGRVTVRARAVDAKRVRIEIEDDGPGISPAVRDCLFEPFVTTKDVGEATGLGLAVCRGLVEGAGGEIGVDAAYDAGARFYVLLPGASPDADG